jgi:hypothetical protein
VIAVEINPRMIEIARVYLPPNGLMTIVRGDFTRLWARVRAIVMLNASWSEDLPEWWGDKLVITDAWWNGLEKRIVIINKGKVVDVVGYEESKTRMGDEQPQFYGSFMDEKVME